MPHPARSGAKSGFCVGVVFLGVFIDSSVGADKPQTSHFGDVQFSTVPNTIHSCPRARVYTAFKMELFNRWGQLIFSTTSVDGRGWDGRLNDVDQPEGVYIYTIEATFRDGQKENLNGNVTLIR